MSYHITPFQMAMIKKTKCNNAGNNMEKWEPLQTVGGNVNSYGCCEIQSSKRIKIELPYDPATPLLVTYLKEAKYLKWVSVP